MHAADLRLLTTRDDFDYDRSLVAEAIRGGGPLVVSGILQKAETLNQNGRVYPHAVLEREVRNYQRLINENRALGELDHPDDSIVNLKNVSHLVREAELDGNVVRGRVEILDTPSGKILRALVAAGVKIGISSRGVGTTKKDGDKHVVQEDFQLICWDFVSEPSTPGAFLLPEGKRLTAAPRAQTLSERIARIVSMAREVRVSP